MVSVIFFRRYVLLACLFWSWNAFAAQPVLVILGDSLSAAYGIHQDEGWVALLQQRVAKEFPKLRIVNASISGDTTRGGLSRIDDVLRTHQPAVIVVELGGNDGLRGLPLKDMQDNLGKIIRKSLDARARVLLLGMKIPPNYGPFYSRGFEAVFKDLADEYKVTRVPFFLDGVALDPQLIQDDGIHPRAAAQPRLLDNVWPQLKLLLPAP